MIHYINLPLLDLTDADFDTKDLQIFYRGRQPANYVSYTFSENTLNKISRLFNKEFLAEIEGIFLQVLSPTFNNVIHRDNRVYAMNFIVEPGGPNVKTCFYDDNSTELACDVIPMHQWHILRVTGLHCVKNIETVRKSITITFKKEIELDNILKLIHV
jgi:hypothetical protein